MKIQAFCVCDAGYIDPAIIAVDSFCRFNASVKVVIYVESGANFKRLKNALIDKRVEFRVVDFPRFAEHDGLCGKFKNLFFKPENLPAYAQRIAALQELKDECDIIINFDLDTLTQGCIITAPFMQYAGRGVVMGVSERENRTNWQTGLNLKDFAPMPNYINTGFGVYGADTIPANIVEQYREFLRNYAADIYCPEQDFLNYLLSEKIKNISSGYNLMFTSKDHRRIYPALIHFVGSMKPWSAFVRSGPECYYWRRYFAEVKLYRGLVADDFYRHVEANTHAVL